MAGAIEKRTECRMFRLLRFIGTLAAVLICALLIAGPARAWTEIPENDLAGLSPEQQTLIRDLPEADRPLAYCWLTGTDALTFFRQNSGFADLIAREGLTSDYPVCRYLTGTRHPDFSTPEGQLEKQFLMELHFALLGEFGSYRDLSQSSVSAFYSEALQNRSLEELRTLRENLDTKPTFNQEELPMWKSVLDTWIVYRGGSAESQFKPANRSLYEAYSQGAYPALEGAERQLLEAMPEVYRLLTYAALSGTDGLSWLRENSPAAYETVEAHWNAGVRELEESYVALVSGGGADSAEAMLLLQLYSLRSGTYIHFNAGSWGIDYGDTIRMQDLARSAEKLPDSMDAVEEFLDRNSASISWESGCDMELACKAWLNYFRSIAPEAAMEEYARRKEAAAYEARAAGLDWEAVQEKSSYALPAVTSLPEDGALDTAQRLFLEQVAARFLPHAYHYLRPDQSSEAAVRACVLPAYRNMAEGFLLYDTAELEAEYVRLATKAAVESLTGDEPARLELCAAILLCRYQDAGKVSFGTLQLDLEKKTGKWAVHYYAESSDPLSAHDADGLATIADSKAGYENGKLLNEALSAQNYRALAEYRKNMRVTPVLSAVAQRICDATVPDMRVYAMAIASGLIAPDSDLVYAEMPEQLWARRENRNYGGMPYAVLNKLLSYYGMPPYRETTHESFYTASNGSLEAIVRSVNQYMPDAIVEAQFILWHRNGEFYSTNGNYHARLPLMSSKKLLSYREILEAVYYAASEPNEIAELANWIEQVNAWMVWKSEQEAKAAAARAEASQASEPSGTPGVWSGVASDIGVPAAERTYILEIATGQVSGENIEFFRIIYETDEGDSRTQYIFPTEDSLSNGYRTAAEAGTPQTVLDWVSTVVGYDTADPLNAEGLRSFHTDQFLFVADGAIRNVTEIQAFMRQDGAGKNEWTCTGLRLYQVGSLRGLERYGYYSSDCYIDFSGSLLTELRFDDENYQNISWRGSDTLFRFGGSMGMNGYSLRTDARSRGIQSATSNVIFRIDFADQYMAGLECLATGYQGANTKSISRPGNLCEALTLQVRYRDVYGSVRDVTLPAVCSTAAWSVLEGGVSGIQDYAGLAQQGESLAFGGTLPDLAEVLSVSPVLGGDAAAATARLTPGTEMTAAALRDSRIAASNSEMASILAIAVYDAGRGALRARYEDSFLRFDFPSLPDKYYRAADITGLRLDAGGAAGQLTLESFTEGSRLTPSDRQERYLITLYTDDVEMAGTRSDILLRLSYEDVDGNLKQTPEFSLRDYAGDYYGYWPASEADFGYLYGLSSGTDTGRLQGRSLSVLLPIQDVQKFTDVTVRLARYGGEDIDEWQMKDLTVQTVGSIGPRRITWQQVTASGPSVYSDRIFSREVDGSIIFTLSRGGAVDPGSPIHPTEPSFEPELFQDGEPVTIHLDTPDVVERQDVDWRSLRYDMTFADTLQDLGFLKARASYTVQVKVASNVDNLSGEDDCGSRNQFYFQLLFAQGGKSAVVLANQQLQSDGFHSGGTEVFTITTNQEYGELSGIRIIPEDMASDSDKYDKLKIESITVIQDGDGELSPLWRFKDVGWIGIDYRDEGEETSYAGVTARTMDELARVYNVTESSYAVNVQIAISTGQYKDRRGEATEQFQGQMSAEVTYRDVNGIIQNQNIEDVVALMYAYNNRPAQYAVQQTSGLFTSGQAISDPNYMFRANHTDRFIVSLDGLEQILNIKLYPRSSVNTVWNISDVNVSLIRGQGRRILNVAGEYTMKYQDGQEPLPIGASDSTGEPKYSKQLFITDGESSTGSPVTVNFTSEKVQTSTTIFENQTVVSELPAGGTESFNVVVYPANAAGGGKLDYDMTVSLRYTTAADAIIQNSGVMNKTVVDGEPVFYLEGLSADGLVQLNSIALKSSRSYDSGISGGFVQRVRSGFVVETYELAAATGLEYGANVAFVNSDAAAQTLLFQLGADMAETRLKNGGNDVAVSVHYRIEGPIGREYQSKRYFLSNEGYSVLRAGQLVTLEFREDHVAEITGITFIPTGQVSLDLGEACVTCSRTDADGVRTGTGYYSFAASSMAPMTGVIRRNVSSVRRDEVGSVTPLYLRFVTGSQDGAGTGIDNPVSMTLGCYGASGVLEERTFEDIRPYIQSGARSFPAGAETEIVILARDVQDVRWAEFTVQPSDGGQLAVWNLSSVSLRLGDSGQPVEREPSENIPEGKTCHLSFANVYMTVELTYPVVPQYQYSEDGTPTPVTVRTDDAEMGLLLGSGQGIRVLPIITGSTEGFRAELLSLEPVSGVTGVANLNSAHTYTGKYLGELKEEAANIVLSGTANEAAAARRVLEAIEELTASPGSFTQTSYTATFMAPRNFTGSSRYFRLTVSYEETGETAFTVDLTIQSEADPLGEAITALRTVQNNELLQRLSGELTGTSGGAYSAPGTGAPEGE